MILQYLTKYRNTEIVHSNTESLRCQMTNGDYCQCQCQWRYLLYATFICVLRNLRFAAKKMTLVSVTYLTLLIFESLLLTKSTDSIGLRIVWRVGFVMTFLDGDLVDSCRNESTSLRTVRSQMSSGVATSSSSSVV